MEKGGRGKGGPLSENKVTRLFPPSSPLSRFSSQGRDVCTWANSRCTVPFPRDINFSGSNLRHFSLPSTSPTSPRQRRSLAFSLSLYSSNGGGERFLTKKRKRERERKWPVCFLMECLLFPALRIKLYGRIVFTFGTIVPRSVDPTMAGWAS